MARSYRIVRLQVQREPLKQGSPFRTYDPAGLAEVVRLEVGPRGARGVTAAGEEILDVHHQDHPRTRDAKGRGGLTVMGTGDYTALRRRYGAHLADGIAGESVLVAAPRGLAGRDLPDRLVLRTAAGDLLVEQLRVADPCVEFSRFCLGRSADTPVDSVVRRTLIELDRGARGYRGAAVDSGIIELGDLVLLG